MRRISNNQINGMTTDSGKILILKLNNRLMSLLIRDNCILSAQVQHENECAVGNIYIGKVQSISDSISAAFVDIGQGHPVFLSLAEAKHAVVTTNRKYDGRLKAGDEILVQVSSEPVKTKLAGVTAKISLAGKYVVAQMHTTASLNKPLIQVSSKLSRKQQEHFRDIDALKRLMPAVQLIIRTNAGELSDETPLIEEAEALTEQLTHILQIAGQRTCFSCLYREKPDYLHFVENTYTSEYDEVITDIPEIYDRIKAYQAQNAIPVRLYEDKMLPLYKLYAVEARIQELLDKRVWLKSGGYLVIEPTEALISIDVNSGKYERGKDKEETALKINMEAAEMIAIHLRARNLSGMILVDFINMKTKEHNQRLMDYMRGLLKKDSVTADIVDMTGLGLVEITRRKISPSFREQYGREEKQP